MEFLLLSWKVCLLCLVFFLAFFFFFFFFFFFLRKSFSFGVSIPMVSILLDDGVQNLEDSKLTISCFFLCMDMRMDALSPNMSSVCLARFCSQFFFFYSQSLF